MMRILINLFITSAPTLHTPVERLFGRRLLWIIACVAWPPRLSFSFSFSVNEIDFHSNKYSVHFVDEIFRYQRNQVEYDCQIPMCVPLSSPFRFFFNDTVTSVLIIEDSLLRSVELSPMVVDVDTAGADSGLVTVLQVVKSAFERERKTTSKFIISCWLNENRNWSRCSISHG